MSRPRGARARDRRLPRAARGSSRGASRWRARSAPRSATGLLGPADPGLRRPGGAGADPRASRPPRTAPTARAACSPATARATSSSPRCTAPASPTSRRPCTRDDGLALRDCWITAAVRCAPPANKPPPAERDAARRGWSASSRCSSRARGRLPRRVRLGRCAARRAPRPPLRPRRRAARRPHALLGCFHPSQQNTFTGKLTPAMIDAVLCAGARAGRMKRYGRGPARPRTWRR